MAAATTLLLASAAVTTGAAVAKSIAGSSMASEAKQAIEGYERQELVNAYEKLAPSTAGAELQAENLMRTTATLSEQAGEMGARGTVGLGSKIMEQETQVSRQIAAQLDEQRANIDRLAASGEMGIQKMRESREQQELAALGQMYQTGRQDMWSGITEATKSLTPLLLTGGDAFASSGGGDNTKVGSNLMTPQTARASLDSAISVGSFVNPSFGMFNSSQFLE